MDEIQKPKKAKHILLRLFSYLVILGIGIASVGLITISIVYPKLPSMDDLRNYKPKLPLQIYSSDGALLGQFGQEHRIYINFDQTPPMLVHAILAAEDERFYQHGGIDYLGVIRAVGANVVSGHIQSGASTITMQVAKNFFLSSRKTFWRKFNEALLAYKIEHSLTKNQILELYINQIYLGQRAYGFAEASRTYFGRPLNKLSIAEYAILAGLPKAPSAYNPVVNKKRSRLRELYVLGRMKSLNFITDKQFNEAINQRIYVIQGSLRDITNSGSYIAEMVRQMLYGKYGEDLYVSGFKVYTTIDSKMQEAAYTALRNGLLDYDNSRGYKGVEQYIDLSRSNNPDSLINSAFNNIADFGDLQVAVVLAANNDSVKVRLRNGNEAVISGKNLDFVKKFLDDNTAKSIRRGAVVRVRNVNDQWTISQTPTVEGGLVALNPNDGAIKALVGGFDFTKNGYNHITQAMRQPGSSFKPFIYSAALSDGLNASTKMDDSAVCYPSNGGTEQWCPENDEKDFQGPVTLRQALTQSLNVPTVKLLNQITPQYAIDYVTKFGFDKSQFQPYLTMALGANEVTPLQMSAAYAVFANGGYLVAPYFIQTITDNAGNIIAKTSPINIHNTERAIDPRNAYVMNSILQDVVRYGTGARAYRKLRRNDMAGKTGTTTDAKDVWFDGYTPNIVAVTWVGYDQPKSLGDHAFGATIALPIWINFMDKTLDEIPVNILPMPAGITIKRNATWKGNDEYFFDSSKVYESSLEDLVESAGMIEKSHESLLEAIAKSNTSTVNNHAASAPITSLEKKENQSMYSNTQASMPQSITDNNTPKTSVAPQQNIATNSSSNANNKTQSVALPRNITNNSNTNNTKPAQNTSSSNNKINSSSTLSNKIHPQIEDIINSAKNN